MKDIDIRYYINNSVSGGKMIYTLLSDYTPELISMTKSQPMLYSGVKDANKFKIYEFDYLQFNLNGETTFGMVKYICKDNFNGFRVFSIKNKESWLLSEMFVNTIL